MNNIQDIASSYNASTVPLSEALSKPEKMRVNKNNTHVQNRVQDFDAYVTNYNSRCGRKKFLLEAADSYIAKNAPKLYLNTYINEKTLNNALKNNPAIAEILQPYALEPEIYMQNVTGKNREHFLTTQEICKKYGNSFQSEEYNALLEAALLHDIGKAFIPPEILNKPAKLTPAEKEIVDLHAKLGYEILKTTGVNPKTSQLVRMHHLGLTDPQKQADLPSQMLSAADVYSALVEERPYKKPLTKRAAKEIMVSDANLNQDYVRLICT